MRLTPAAAEVRWPVMDFGELTHNRSACGPNSFRMATVSLASLPGVEVPWAEM